MSKLSFNNVAIRAITAAAPSHVQVIDTEIRTNARFVAQMGIAQRHISVTEQTSLELGYVAVKDALDKAGWQTSDLDLLIFNTQFPDFNVGNSFLLQHYLSLRPDCLIFDQIMCCAALPYVLTTACTYLQQPNIKRAAIVLGDTVWSMYPNKEALLQAERFTFGDGTAVMLLEQDEHAPPLDTYLYADGSGFKYLFNSNYSIRNAWRNYERYLTPDGTPHGKRDLGYSYYYMNGFYITLFASKNMSDQIKQIWGDQISAYDYFAFHQGNKQIIDMLSLALHLPKHKVLTSFEEYGNTNGASPLITLCHRLAHNEQAMHIFNASMGAGLAWGFTDMQLDPNVIQPVLFTDLVFEDLLFKEITVEPNVTAEIPRRLYAPYFPIFTRFCTVNSA